MIRHMQKNQIQPRNTNNSQGVAIRLSFNYRDMKPLITILILLMISLSSEAQSYAYKGALKSYYAYQDSSLPSNLDTIIRRDSTLGIIIYIDTAFTLRTAICLRVHSLLIIKYKPKWFYNADDVEYYLTLNDGRWIPDIDDNKWMEFIPSAQFQDYKIRPGVKNWEVIRP